MHARALRCLVVVVAAAAVLGLAACRTSAPVASTTAAAGGLTDPWTTPPPPGTPMFPARPAPATSLQPAPQLVDEGTTWSGTGAPLPPGGAAVAPTPGEICPPPCPPAQPVLTRQVAPVVCYDGCGLPCEQGISQWHVRGVGGIALWAGTDAPDDCAYWGADVGRTFCGCWGLDAYYRYNSGQFTRAAAGGTFLDGGEWHHIGAKLTWEKAFRTNSRWYGWVGLGGGYFWTEDYRDDDSGWEIYGEAGVGYVLSEHWRIRVGVNVHGMDTDVTRRNPIDDGRSRWLWLIAPVGQIEADF